MQTRWLRSTAEKGPWSNKIGNENSAQSFSDPKFLEIPYSRGRLRLRVMDVRAEMLVCFPGF